VEQIGKGEELEQGKFFGAHDNDDVSLLNNYHSAGKTSQTTGLRKILAS
jgi:hypothetical protein